MGARDEVTTALSGGAPWLGQGDVALDAITLDERLQPRMRIDDRTTKRYAADMRGGAVFPPVTLGDVGGQLLLIDGWHRVAAVRMNGGASIAATVTPMNRKEALQAAALANMFNAKPLTRQERKNAFKLFIKGGGHQRGRGRGLKSYREIAVELGGVGYTTVRNWMQKCFPAVFRDMGGREGGGVDGEGFPTPAEPGVMDQLRPLMTDVDNLSVLLVSPFDRWRVIRRLESTLAKLRELPFEEPPPDAY